MYGKTEFPYKIELLKARQKLDSMPRRPRRCSALLVGGWPQRLVPLRGLEAIESAWSITGIFCMEKVVWKWLVSHIYWMFHNYFGCCKCRMCNKRWKSGVDEAPERTWGVCDFCPFTLCADCMGRNGCALRFDDGHERICSQNPR